MSGASSVWKRARGSLSPADRSTEATESEGKAVFRRSGSAPTQLTDVRLTMVC